MSALGREWDAAVAAAYEATREHRPEGSVEGCSHCVSVDEMRALHHTPRETAPADLVGHFGFKAMTTWGGPRDFRWFLPRILELMATERVGVLWLELIAEKALSADFALWPERERAALRGMLIELFRLRLDGRAPVEVRDLMAACALLGVDRRPLLAQLSARAVEDEALAEELVALVEKVAFTPSAPAETDPAVVRFVLCEETLAHIERLFFRHSSGSLGQRLSIIVQCLEMARDQGLLAPDLGGADDKT
jgi:hypothetical protein